MSAPLVLVDADVLGRQRTGDETYVEQLLRHLPLLGDELRYAAVTRHPELVPEGVQAVRLDTGAQQLRMAWALPRLLRRLQPSLLHSLHVLPLRCRVPAIVTVQDLSFERDRRAMPLLDGLTFRLMVPRAVKRAARVLTISERSKRDLVEVYGLAPEKVVVTHLAVDPIYTPNGSEHEDFLLFVGAVQARKDPLTAAHTARALGRRLVVAGPLKDSALARELEGLGAELRGYVSKEELASLYRRAACLLFPTRYEGFGLPVLEAMASGTPVVAAPDPAVREAAGEAALLAEPEAFPAAVERALRERDRLVRAGLAQARRFSWLETARRVREVYLEVLGAKGAA
ncbi:MAG: glycosyltransferase family 4 protein [Gaiellaceae bacterium]